MTSATAALARRAAVGVGTSWVGDTQLQTFAAYGFGATLAALLVLHHAEVAISLPTAAVLCALGLSLLGRRVSLATVLGKFATNL